MLSLKATGYIIRISVRHVTVININRTNGNSCINGAAIYGSIGTVANGNSMAL